MVQGNSKQTVDSFVLDLRKQTTIQEGYRGVRGIVPTKDISSNLFAR